MPLPRQGQYIARTTIMFAVSASHARAWGFGRMASVDNPKASKATKYGFLNAILYMAPASSADGTFNLCANAGSCVALCLGRESGQAAIRKAGQERTPYMDGRGKWIWLTPKGNKARRDESGFVVRLAA
jgi:hypothetical protein